MAISFKGAHFPPDIILMGVRWYVAYPLSAVSHNSCENMSPMVCEYQVNTGCEYDDHAADSVHANAH